MILIFPSFSVINNLLSSGIPVLEMSTGLLNPEATSRSVNNWALTLLVMMEKQRSKSKFLKL